MSREGLWTSRQVRNPPDVGIGQTTAEVLCSAVSCDHHGRWSSPDVGVSSGISRHQVVVSSGAVREDLTSAGVPCCQTPEHMRVTASASAIVSSDVYPARA